VNRICLKEYVFFFHIFYEFCYSCARKAHVIRICFHNESFLSFDRAFLFMGQT
jgi:hypothetical protein